jgi:phosphonoacetaldehyde hydrolase
MNLRDRFDMVVFDWAGTMVDFGSEAPVKAMIEAFDVEGVAIDAAAVRRDMGKAKRDHVTGMFTNPVVSNAWQARHGRAADDADVERIMVRLGPLMREQAARASILIPGARETFDQLRAAGFKIASSTGYTREMMEPVLARAAEQGYSPDHVVCSGETLAGRPSPLMIYKACVDLAVWPLSRVIKVDDAEVGIAEGKAAGAFTVGVASGNALGLSLNDFQALSTSERTKKVAGARQSLLDAGADLVIDSVATLVPALAQSAGTREKLA